MTLTRRSATTYALLLGILAGLSGCSKLAPVSGKVLYKNEGVTAGAIYFIPDASKGNQGSGGSSLLQLDGSFTITNPEEGRGAVGVRPGAYKATVVLNGRREKDLQKFKDVKQTPLQFDVPAEGLRDLVIQLDEPVGQEAK
jgi:hypothetical protein